MGNKDCSLPIPGQQYDKDGILRQWWTNTSVEHFKERQVCFEKQYSQYKLFGYSVSTPNAHTYQCQHTYHTCSVYKCYGIPNWYIQINGNLTLGENIADNGGLHTSYQAFRSLMNTTQQYTLPALKYTPEQLYFIAYGQVCIVSVVVCY